MKNTKERKCTTEKILCDRIRCRKPHSSQRDVSHQQNISEKLRTRGSEL